MKRRFYTIFILPHAHARFRQLHLSRNFMISLVAVVVVALLGGALAPHLIFKVRAQSAELERLQEDYAKLQEEKARFLASLDELGARVGSLESRAVRLAEAVGISRLPEPKASGGAAPRSLPRGGSVSEEEVVGMGARLQTLDLTFQQIDGAWDRRSQILAHTPTGLPVEGFFSDGYGWRADPFTGEKEFHRGLDIVAPSGTPVQAPADGLVVKAGRTAGYGKMVQVSHGFGLSTLYGHLSEFTVRPGQKVRRGDVLGKVGSSGRSTGPHLHYEVFREGRQVNPRPFVGDRAF